MAVKPTQQLVRNYWPRYKRRSLLLVIGMQLITTLVVAGALMLAGITEPDNVGFWITILAIVASTLGINLIVFSIITEPLEMLSNAITHASGEQSNTTPPNPNAKRYEKNGLKPLLLTIYQNGGGISSDTTVSSDTNQDQNFDIKTALNTTSTGVVFMDQDGHVTYSNTAAPIRTNIDGSLALDLLFESDESSIEAWLKECNERSVHAEKTWKRIATKITGEENRKIYDMVASYQKGSAVEVVITLIERTDDYLPEDNDLDFIAFAAHELRGPITVIRGYLDTLGDELAERLADDEVELFSRLVVSANRLSSYVNNILNAAKYDRRHLKVHLHEESLADIYDSIKDDMLLRAQAQNRILTVNLPDTLPSVAADKASIGEVLGNLIDNAIKYSNDGGSVEVSAQVIGETVEVAIKDYGIGMPGNVVSNLFHKFYRSHRSRETVAGTGIGLYICKAIIESHGGTVGVRSVEGQGSTFTFTLFVYATVADKLKASNNSNEGFIEHHNGWIKNHGAYRG